MTSEKIIKKTKKPYKLEEGSLSKFTEAALSVSGLLYHRVHLGGIPTMGANGKIFLRENPMKGYPDFDMTTYRDWETDRKSTRLNSSHRSLSRMPSSA